MKLNIFFLIVFAAFIASCEDVIQVELPTGDAQLVIDAWINDKPETQTIRLVRTSPYFDSSPSPAELGAIVGLSNQNNEIFIFEDSNNDGNYIWEPPAGESIGTVGDEFFLGIQTADGVEYGSYSKMNRIMEIDSIGSELRPESLGTPEGIYAAVYAKDFEGQGDAYWIKTYKNGQFLNKPLEINIAFDAGFTAGAGVDGVNFILPIRENVNRLADTGEGAIDTDSFPPYVFGDSIHIEIHSINIETFFFLQLMQAQLTLGDASIFAAPPSNVPCNVIVNNSEEAKDQPVGFFNVSAVSEKGRRF